MLFRAWFYFRQGYSTYISFPLGFISTVIVVYSLGIKPVIESGGFLGSVFQILFPRLTNFTIIAAVVLIPVCVYLGLLHFRKTGAFGADASISTEGNPYVYKAVPGKEEEVFIPLWTLTAKALAKMLEQQNSMTPEERKQFEESIRKADLLMAGRTVGVKAR